MDEPVRILSDLHLGHRISRITEVESLRPLIAGAGTVIFNGDTWQELATSLRPRSEELLDALRSLCREEAVTPVFLSGNHDPGWEGPGWVELAGGRIVVTHGDALLFAGSPWKREILTCGDRLEQLWDEFPAAGVDPGERLRLARRIARELFSLRHPRGKALWQRAWDAVTPPTRGLRMLEAWLAQGTNGSAFCERYFPAAEFLIIGHFHLHGSWQAMGRRILNTGSFVPPGKAQWIEWQEGWLRRGDVTEPCGIFHRGPVRDVWRLP